jgi:hypothetical protein
MQQLIDEAIETIKGVVDNNANANIGIIVGDADDYYMDAYDGDTRNFVWINYMTQLSEAAVWQEKFIARFNSYEVAEHFAKSLKLAVEEKLNILIKMI